MIEKDRLLLSKKLTSLLKIWSQKKQLIL